MKDKDFKIERLVNRFDEYVAAVESVWGIGRLEQLVDDDLALKWQTHIDNFDNAVMRGDVRLLTQIVEGTPRGLQALEESAKANGHEPSVEYWSGKFPDGREFRVYKTNTDSYGGAEKGVVRYSLEEIGKILAANDIMNAVKEQFGGTVTSIKKKGHKF